jgi:hypothetical protein
LVCHATTGVLPQKVCVVSPANFKPEFARIMCCAAVHASSRSEFVMVPSGWSWLTISHCTSGMKGLRQTMGGPFSGNHTSPMPDLAASTVPMCRGFPLTSSFMWVGLSVVWRSRKKVCSCVFTAPRTVILVMRCFIASCRKEKQPLLPGITGTKLQSSPTSFPHWLRVAYRFESISVKFLSAFSRRCFAT